MGILGTILGILLPAIIGIGATWLGNKVNNSSLTGAQQQQNTFNAFEAQQQREWSSGEAETTREYNSEEAQINRDFNAEQAQIDRDFQAEQAQKQMDFQERMDNTAYQRKIADMKAAGVNPALAVGGISVGATSGAAGSGALASGSAASAGTPSGAAASGSAPHFPVSMSDMMQSGFMAKNLSLLDSQIQMNDAKTMRDLAEAGLLGEQRIGQSLSNKWFEPMKEAELNNIKDVLNNNRVERALKRSQISVNEAQESLTVTQTAIAHADASIREELNRASLRLTLAQASLDEKRIDEVQASINELYQRAIMESLQGGMYSANEFEAMARAGLIESQTVTNELENETKRYTVNHKKLNYWLGVAGTTANVIGSFAPAAIGLSAVGRIGKSAASSYTPLKGASMSKPSSYFVSKTPSSLLTNYVSSW